VLASRALVGVPPAQRDLPGLVGGLLADAGRSFADVTRIAVDVGPGNLTAVPHRRAYDQRARVSPSRAGVATANSLELMAAQAGPAVPVLCLRNAGRRTGVRRVVRRRRRHLPARATGPRCCGW
jgi:hypothetical protein